MMATTVRLISALALVVGLSACATTGISDEEALANAGAVRLDASEIKARVTGKTEEWHRGGAYYEADGNVRIKWRKAYSKGTWQVNDNGELCFEVPYWENRCQFYMKLNGDVYLLDEGKNMGIMRVLDGDRLASVGSFNTGEARTR